MELRSLDPTAGIAVMLGLFVVLAGVATVVGMPWQYLNGGLALTALRVLGALLAVAIGASLVRLAVDARRA